MAKKIKSFTTDEDVYNRLVTMFKEYGAESSISMYLNNKLKDLLNNLEFLEKGFRDENISVPMSFVIDELVKKSEGIPSMVWTDAEEKETYLTPIEYWKDSYEAFKKGIPLEYYGWLEGNSNFELSKDKKFLIDKETGQKYISDGASKLMVVREFDLDNIVKKS
jgi:hypothetical protein